MPQFRILLFLSPKSTPITRRIHFLDFMQVFWLATLHSGQAFPVSQWRADRHRHHGRTPRLQRRDRTGFSPVSLLAVYGPINRT